MIWRIFQKDQIIIQDNEMLKKLIDFFDRNSSWFLQFKKSYGDVFKELCDLHAKKHRILKAEIEKKGDDSIYGYYDIDFATFTELADEITDNSEYDCELIKDKAQKEVEEEIRRTTLNNVETIIVKPIDLPSRMCLLGNEENIFEGVDMKLFNQHLTIDRLFDLLKNFNNLKNLTIHLDQLSSNFMDKLRYEGVQSSLENLEFICKSYEHEGRNLLFYKIPPSVKNFKYTFDIDSTKDAKKCSNMANFWCGFIINNPQLESIKLSLSSKSNIDITDSKYDEYRKLEKLITQYFQFKNKTDPKNEIEYLKSKYRLFEFLGQKEQMKEAVSGLELKKDFFEKMKSENNDSVVKNIYEFLKEVENNKINQERIAKFEQNRKTKNNLLKKNLQNKKLEKQKEKQSGNTRYNRINRNNNSQEGRLFF